MDRPRSKHAVLRPRRVARHPDRRRSHAPFLDAEPVRPGLVASRRPALTKGILVPLTMYQGAFLMRGLANVRAEFSLTALAYNLRRALDILGVETMSAAVAA